MGAEVEQASRAAAVYSPWEEGLAGSSSPMQTEEAPGAQGGEVTWRAHVNSDLVDVR